MGKLHIPYLWTWIFKAFYVAHQHKAKKPEKNASPSFLFPISHSFSCCHYSLQSKGRNGNLYAYWRERLDDEEVSWEWGECFLNPQMDLFHFAMGIPNYFHANPSNIFRDHFTDLQAIWNKVKCKRKQLGNFSVPYGWQLKTHLVLQDFVTWNRCVLSLEKHQHKHKCKHYPFWFYDL